MTVPRSIAKTHKRLEAQVREFKYGWILDIEFLSILGGCYDGIMAV